MKEDNVWILIVVVCLVLGGFFMWFIMIGPDIEVLADAICLEKHGTNFERFEYEDSFWNNKIEKIICKAPVIEKDKYDGLIVEMDLWG